MTGTAEVNATVDRGGGKDGQIYPQSEGDPLRRENIVKAGGEGYEETWKGQWLLAGDRGVPRTVALGFHQSMKTCQPNE